MDGCETPLGACLSRPGGVTKRIIVRAPPGIMGSPVDTIAIFFRINYKILIRDHTWTAKQVEEFLTESSLSIGPAIPGFISTKWVAFAAHIKIPYRR